MMNLNDKKAQQVVEYLLVAGVVIAVLAVFTRDQGLFRGAVNRVLWMSTEQLNASIDEVCQGPNCGVRCHNGVCEAQWGETCETCEADCGPCIACPNGVCEEGETCKSCEADCGPCEVLCPNGHCDTDFGENYLTCPADCPAPLCGNGVLNGDEACDPGLLVAKPPVFENGADCSRYGDGQYYAECGQVTCNEDCSVNANTCCWCGDGRKNGPAGVEECDRGAVDVDCKGATGDPEAQGEVWCSDDCKYDTSKCYYCGDGEIDPETGEECDPGLDRSQWTKNTCESFEGHYGDASALTCDEETCTVDYSGCGYCGDGTVDAGHEQCEGTSPGQMDCVGQGFDGGTLRCHNCQYDTSGCYKCGDGEKNGPDEQCDGSDGLAGVTCQTVTGHADALGDLACSADCTYDTSGCYDYCGDGVLDPNDEECDPGPPPVFPEGKTACSEYQEGYTGGDLVCTKECKISLENCLYCGDGQCDSWEEGVEGNCREDCGCHYTWTHLTGFTSCTDETKNPAPKECCKYTPSFCEEVSDSTCICEAGQRPVGTVVGGTAGRGSECADPPVPAVEEIELGPGYSCQPLITPTTTPSCCGDGEVDGPEECDGDVSIDCTTIEGEDYEGGEATCGPQGTPEECRYDLSDCYKCGDDRVNGPVGQEDCDGADMGRAGGCEDLGLLEGTLGCYAPGEDDECTYDTSGCGYCGDDKCDPTEQTTCPDDCGCVYEWDQMLGCNACGGTYCEDKNAGGGLDWPAGAVCEQVLNSNCTCGADERPSPRGTRLSVIQGGNCELGIMGKEMWQVDKGYECVPVQQRLEPVPPCCGDGVVDEGEDCDQNTESCELLGTETTKGDLTCYPQNNALECQWNAEACLPPECGDGEIDSPETCDPNAADPFNGKTCADFQDNQGRPYTDGFLTCPSMGAAACQVDTSHCTVEVVCGDGYIDPPETCEKGSDWNPADFQGNSCVGYGWTGGHLTCRRSDCQIDQATCYRCINLPTGATPCAEPATTTVTGNISYNLVQTCPATPEPCQASCGAAGYVYYNGKCINNCSQYGTGTDACNNSPLDCVFLDQPAQCGGGSSCQQLSEAECGIRVDYCEALRCPEGVLCSWNDGMNECTLNNDIECKYVANSTYWQDRVNATYVGGGVDRFSGWYAEAAFWEGTDIIRNQGGILNRIETATDIYWKGSYRRRWLRCELVNNICTNKVFHYIEYEVCHISKIR